MPSRIKPSVTRLASTITLAVYLLVLCGAWPQYSSATSVKIPSASAKSLTSEAEAILDKWRGQTPLLDQAAEKLSLALKQDPKNAKAYVQLGRLHIMDNQYRSQHFEPSSFAASETAIKKAIELDGKLAEAYVLLGHLYTVMNRIPEAKTALVKAAEIKTDSPWLALNWAAILDKENKYDEAAQTYLRVIASKPKSVKALGTAYQGIQAYYMDKRDFVKAEQAYRAQIALEPTNAWARGNYASSLVYLIGDFDKGMKRAREALAIMNYDNAQRTLAFALYGKWATDAMANRNNAATKKYFEEAQSLYPDLAAVREEALKYPGTKIIEDALRKGQ